MVSLANIPFTRRILCIGGSSITHTPGLQAHWTNELALALGPAQQAPGARKLQGDIVFEYSDKRGRTLHELLRDPVLFNLITTGGWHLVVLEVGTTDARRHGTPKRLYADALHQMLQRFYALDIPVLMCTPPRVISRPTAQEGWGRRVRRWIEYVPTMMRQAAADCEHAGHRVAVVHWDEMPEGMYQADGVHPDQYGAAWMSHRVLEGISTLGIMPGV